MSKLTQQQAREFGIGQGYQMALASGSAEAPSEGWDAMLVNANPQLAREKLGWDGPNMSAKTRRLIDAYCEGCQVGADAAIEANHTKDYDECVYEVQDEQRQVLTRTESERDAILHAKEVANSRVVMYVKSGTHESATIIYPDRGETYSN